MSRIGKKPIPVPSGVKVDVRDHTVKVAGPKGELTWTCPDRIKVEHDTGKGEIRVSRATDQKQDRALHGLTRALIQNMVTGVSQGYEKRLEVYGTGYSCRVQGKQFLLNCGYMGRGVNRPAQFVIDVPAGLTVDVEVQAARGESEPAKFVVRGADKQAVGMFAAQVRAIRKPEPYQGKGIRYAGEHVRRKQGKAFAGGGG